jgi:hypothetical protein
LFFDVFPFFNAGFSQNIPDHRPRLRRGGIYRAVFLLVLICQAILLAFALLAGRGGCAERLLISPLDLHSPRFGVHGVEQFCKDAFLMTYEIKTPASAGAVRGVTGKQVIAIATNSCYPLIMGYRTVRGAFFTERAWDDGDRHVVLNEAAAWGLFGSIGIDGRTLSVNGGIFLVTGVLDDEYDEEVIYLPSSIGDSSGSKRTAASFMALLGAERGVTKAYAEHALKALGIQSAQFGFTDLADIERTYWERLWASLKALYCVAIFVSAYKAWIRFKDAIRRYKSRMQRYYLSELLYKNRMTLIKAAACGVLLFIAASVALSFMPHILTAFLNRRGSISVLLTDDYFSRKTALLRTFYVPDTAAFIASIVFICAGGTFCAWNTPRGTRMSR